MSRRPVEVGDGDGSRQRAQGIEAVPHLVGRLAREGDGQDRLRPHVLPRHQVHCTGATTVSAMDRLTTPDQERREKAKTERTDAMAQSEGLAGARAGTDQERAFDGRLGRLPLLRVQAGMKVAVVHTTAATRGGGGCGGCRGIARGRLRRKRVQENIKLGPLRR
jgi:hypothetical protein